MSQIVVVAQHDDFTQPDLKAITRTLPFQNALGIKNMIELLANELPEE